MQDKFVVLTTTSVWLVSIDNDKFTVLTVTSMWFWLRQDHGFGYDKFRGFWIVEWWFAEGRT